MKKNSKKLVKKYGIRGALQRVRDKIPCYIPPSIRHLYPDYEKWKRVEDQILEDCPHNRTKTICTDFHRSLWGRVCEDCGTYL